VGICIVPLGSAGGGTRCRRRSNGASQTPPVGHRSRTFFTQDGGTRPPTRRGRRTPWTIVSQEQTIQIHLTGKVVEAEDRYKIERRARVGDRIHHAAPFSFGQARSESHLRNSDGLLPRNAHRTGDLSGCRLIMVAVAKPTYRYYAGLMGAEQTAARRVCTLSSSHELRRRINPAFR